MRTNTGEIDRIIRILIGITLIMAGIIFISGVIGYVIVFFGLVLLITGIVGICPLYNLLGFSSKGQGIDRISKKDIEEAVKNYKSSESEEEITKIKPEKTSNISKEKTKKKEEAKKKPTTTASAEKNKKMKATVKDKKEEKKKTPEPKEEKTETRIYPSRLPNFSLETVKGIGKRNANRLKKMKLDNTAKFLAKAATKKGREEISKETGIETGDILTWANHIDLFRVKGIRENYANLLHEADVNTIPELANRNAQNLFETLTKANNEKKLVKSMPNEKEVKMWVNNAKRLKRVISY